MPRVFLCQYGNCYSTDTTLTVSNPASNERLQFCSFAHLALWAKQRALRNADSRNDSISLADKHELGLE